MSRTSPTEDPSTQAPRAAALLVGNELLSGKIRDENGWHLARFLRRRGVFLAEMGVVGDDVETIAAHLSRLLASPADMIFTSGGVGPTHDDRTLEAVARATSRPLVRHEGMARLLERHYGDRATPEALSMAMLPEGTVPCALPGWPVLRLALPGPPPKRIYILPGVPALFRAKLDQLAAMPEELPASPGWVLRQVDLATEENRIAAFLARLEADHPPVEVGSYPRWVPDGNGGISCRVRVTLEAPLAHEAVVAAAYQRLLARFGPLGKPPPAAE